jgi:hypothetical protein
MVLLFFFNRYIIVLHTSDGVNFWDGIGGHTHAPAFSLGRQQIRLAFWLSDGFWESLGGDEMRRKWGNFLKPNKSLPHCCGGRDIFVMMGITAEGAK